MRCVPIAAFVWAVLLGSALGQDMAAVLELPGSPTDRRLTTDEVVDVLNSALEQYEACFVSTLGGREIGEVFLYLTIGNDGIPSQVHLDAADAPGPLASCVEGIVLGLRFDDHDGDPVSAAYPLVWKVDERGARMLPYGVVWFRERPVPLPLVVLPAGHGLDGAQRLEARLFNRPEPAASE
jgi:hypothetical protein